MFIPLICHGIFPIGCHRPYEFSGKSILSLLSVVIFIEDFFVDLKLSISY